MSARLKVTRLVHTRTGADLKRLAEEGKLLLAQDRVEKHSLRPSTDYFLQAIETVRANKSRYAEAHVRRHQRPIRGPQYDHVGAAPDEDGEQD